MPITEVYFYQGTQPSTVLIRQRPFTLFRNGAMPLAESGHFNNVAGIHFTLSDCNKSVLNTITGGPISYTPFGYSNGKENERLHQAFNGQIHRPLGLCYLLGNGRRAYKPALMRFCSADTESPFESGGINAYAYCGADPINYSDPSAHTRVKNTVSGKAPELSRSAQRHSKPYTRTQAKTFSRDEKFDLAQQLIQGETPKTSAGTFTTSDLRKFSEDLHEATKNPWIKKQPDHLRPSAEERNTLRDWAVREPNIGLTAANAWLDAHALELNPVHTLLEVSGYDRAAAKKTNRIISNKMHKIRFGY